MSVDAVNGAAISQTPEQNRTTDREQIKKFAQEFEAMLMTQMIREMRRSMIDEDEQDGDGFGASAMTDTGDIEFGKSLAKTGGLGLTDSLLRTFQRQITGTSDVEATQLVGPPAAPAHIVDTVAARADMSQTDLLAKVTSAPVSSAFGLRHDPFTGEMHFHKGVDIGMAYGADVKAAAGGEVAFSGVQNGYGNTVVINHEGGRQTRYAHLSEQFVQAGDIVQEGQSLGRSGNSGRSTGPHLHFEALVNGKPVDPGEVHGWTRSSGE